ncbi:MAG: hypothetical protein Kow0074_02460 [Candidatus Zixiibacteriota bacterium]
MNLEGRQIGRFELVAELGRGAMGVVYRGRDPHLGRQVAIKVLAPELASDEEMVTRFTDEARHASQLIHQNIATVFEAGPSPEGWYVAFELVEGQTLKAILSKEGVLDIDMAVNYILQTAEGLAAAHRGQVVHRDLKPENLIVTPEGVIKITDFGLAKRMGDPGKTRAGTILGTAFYMAPEQAKGMPVDFRADWFSLGVMAYEMVTGKRPFDGYHEMAILYAVVNEAPEPVASLRQDTPAPLIESIDRMMAKDADARLCDIAELRTLLAPAGTSKVERSSPGIGIPTKSMATPSAPATVSADAPPILAVLPLENKSPDPEFAYLAEGFAEDIGATLSQCERFEVLGHDRVLNGKPESGSSDEWAAALGARYVLYGSLFRAGDKLKLRLSLRDRSTGKVDWTQAFAGNRDDIFEFQEDVAQQVLQALTGEAPTRSFVARPSTTSNAEAYDFYLRGRDYYRREGHENLEFAISMFDKALAIDSQYAAAHAAMADAYAQMYLMYYDRDTKWLKKAETAAKTALMIDSNLPEAHRALGRVMMEYGQNDDAIEQFQVAIKKNPEFYEAYRTLAWIYQGMRQYNDSISWGEKSLRIKPMDRETYLLLGLNYLDLRDWDKARHHFERAIELSPDYGRAYLHLGNVHQKTGDLQGAVKLYKTALKFLTDINAYLDLGWAQLLNRELREAREAYNRLITEGALEFLAFYYLGVIDELDDKPDKASGRFESVISICRRQLSSDPANPYCLMTLAQSQARMGQHELAITSSAKAGKIEEGNGAITLELARVLALVGDEPGAVHAIEQALRQPMGPSIFEVKNDPHFDKLDLSHFPGGSRIIPPSTPGSAISEN